MTFSSRILGTSVFLTFLIFSEPLLATDGVIEINQAKALIGGVSISDTPGFPVTIGSPGSYRLTGNLIVEQEIRVIQIEGSDVTLDLNGFSIIGPTSCTAGTSNCLPGSGNGFGVWASSGTSDITVRNGQISGTGAGGVHCSNSVSCTLENLTVSNASGYGLSVGPRSRVSHCNSQSNGLSGIRAFASSIIDNNILSLNGTFGVDVEGDGVLITSNTFYWNGITEIYMDSKITSIGGNSLTPKVSGNWFDLASKMTEISPNLCIDNSAPYTNCTGL